MEDDEPIPSDSNCSPQSRNLIVSLPVEMYFNARAPNVTALKHRVELSSALPDGINACMQKNTDLHNNKCAIPLL